MPRNALSVFLGALLIGAVVRGGVRLMKLLLDSLRLFSLGANGPPCKRRFWDGVPALDVLLAVWAQAARTIVAGDLYPGLIVLLQTSVFVLLVAAGLLALPRNTCQGPSYEFVTTWKSRINRIGMVAYMYCAWTLGSWQIGSGP